MSLRRPLAATPARRRRLIDIHSIRFRFVALAMLIMSPGIGSFGGWNHLMSAPFLVAMRAGARSSSPTSTSRRYGGTGLGLTISRTLAELMGGRMCC